MSMYKCMTCGHTMGRVSGSQLPCPRCFPNPEREKELQEIQKLVDKQFGRIDNKNWIMLLICVLVLITALVVLIFVVSGIS